MNKNLLDIQISLNILRFKKILISSLNPCCWKALCHGVAPTIEHIRILQSLSIDGIIDVGANRGQFALACRLAVPAVQVVSFEPIPTEAATFRKVHEGVSNISLVESALGETNGIATLHLSKSADSSSLLPIGRLQTKLHQNTDEVGTIEVKIHRLDDLKDHWQQKKRLLLKLDVQGFELSVLKGSREALKHCAYVYAECSEVPLYDGQALRPEVESFLEGQGFKLQSRHNEQWDLGKLIQADYLFERI